MPAWPGSNDYFEAVQAPAAFFADPDLKAAEAVCGAMGTPVACSGNFADVYQLRSRDGSKSWAVKCFTKPVARLRERYREISRHLQRNAPRLMVDFQYLDQGIRIGGESFPVLKMDWVEGLTLRNYVEENLRKPKQLQKLYEIWLNVEPLLRKAGLAHGDLQHGNVLLVPGKTKDTLSLRLVDYDGLWVPALKGQPATEVGHPAYQHPDRARRNLFAPEIDLFPHFLIAASLRCLAHAEGPGLWKAFDNGDNLLFKKSDLEVPGASPLFKALWDSGVPELAQWAGGAAACLAAPLESTPLLQRRVSGKRTFELTNRERQVARDVLGKHVRDTLGDEFTLREDPLLETDGLPEREPPEEVPEQRSRSKRPRPKEVATVELRIPRRVFQFIISGAAVLLLLVGGGAGLAYRAASTSPATAAVPRPAPEWRAPGEPANRPPAVTEALEQGRVVWLVNGYLPINRRNNDLYYYLIFNGSALESVVTSGMIQPVKTSPGESLTGSQTGNFQARLYWTIRSVGPAVGDRKLVRLSQPRNFTLTITWNRDQTEGSWESMYEYLPQRAGDSGKAYCLSGTPPLRWSLIPF